jgi:hypothetical protein
MNGKQAKAHRAKAKQHANRIGTEAMQALTAEIQSVYEELGFWGRVKLCKNIIAGRHFMTSLMQAKAV